MRQTSAFAGGGEQLGKNGPYVGLRPYERSEHHLFFGRDRDTQRLVDRILSSPITVLYAQSGLGKTSLLRALVIPQLEAEHSSVFYFDAWRGEEPEKALKALLLQRCKELGLPWPSAVPTLVELVRLTASADMRTPVLVLDQFEEFLLEQGQRLDPLRNELAALIRAANLDAHVVLSLREEFLAALEPFRHSILDLFQSTYRLESLDDDGVRGAIVKPAAEFKVEYEPALVDALLSDLRPKDTPSVQDNVRQSIELPMLQLVCSQFWKTAAAQGTHTLTLASYESVGRADKILDVYVRSVMPRRWRDRLLTAKLMEKLAPPSGYKNSYSADDLARDTGLNQQRINAELKRLDGARILQVRNFRSRQRYELEHDAFIKVIAPWRDRVLAQARALRLARRGVGVAALVVFLVSAVIGARHIQQQQEIHSATEGMLENLNKLRADEAERSAESSFDLAAGNLLWRFQDPERLREVLSRHEDKLPTGYGISRSGLESIALRDEDWPFVLTYSATRRLDQGYFAQGWQLMAQGIAKSWGIPVPAGLFLKSDSALPTRLMRVDGPDSDPVNFDIESYEHLAVVTAQEQEKLPEPVKKVVERFPNDWLKIKNKNLPSGSQLWGVPRWSLPFWKVAGHPANDGSFTTALLVAYQILHHPEFLLNPEVVRLLLERTAETYPDTVAEAQRARGDRLPMDLAEIIKLGLPLTHLSTLLDMLADVPNETSENTARFVAERLQTPMAAAVPLRGQLHGPWPDGGTKPVPKDTSGVQDGVRPTEASSNDEKKSDDEKKREAVVQAFRQIEPWLAPMEQPIRAYVGAELEPGWKGPVGKGPVGELAPALQERIELLRDKLFEQVGILMPAVRVRTFDYDKAGVASRQFRIEVLNQVPSDAYAQPIDAEPGDGLNQFIRELLWRAELFRVHWINAEYVQWTVLEGVSPGLREWLESRYSLTDLKLLLRAVVNPTLEKAAPESTIRHVDWLLSSLVFWNAVATDPHDLDAIADRLRKTQRARLQPQGMAVPVGEAEPVVAGVRALIDGNVQEAERLFRQAAQGDLPGTIQMFLVHYPRQLQLQIQKRLEQSCSDLDRVKLTRDEQLDLEDMIGTAPGAVPSDLMRRLKLCLLPSYDPKLRPQGRTSLLQSFLSEAGRPGEWPAQEAAYLGHALINEYDPTRTEDRTLDAARRLLESALRRLEEPQADDAFYKLIEVCGASRARKSSRARKWCWDLVDGLAKAVPTGDIPLALAHRMSSSLYESRHYLQRALEHAEQAEKNLRSGNLSIKDREWKADFLTYSRAKAYRYLAALGNHQLWPEAKRLLQNTLKSEAVGQLAHEELIGLLIDQEHFVEARDLIKSAIQRWPDHTAFPQLRLWMEIAEGNMTGVADTAASLADKAGDNVDLMFSAAIGQLLTGTGDWNLIARRFIEAGEDYAAYVAALLYAFEDGDRRQEARRLLERRWEVIDPGSWDVRLEHGDPNVWPEMLIGYYLDKADKVKRDELFAPLADEATYEASQFRNLPLSRQGMRCEAYFYDALLAKVQGDCEGMKRDLSATIETQYRPYVEYKMAKFLLAREGGTCPGSAADGR